MMAKTHFFMGMATSLIVCNPTDIKTGMLALIGGAVGGVAADIDTVGNDYKHDALIGQLLAAGTTFSLLIIDYFGRFGLWNEILSENSILLKAGVFLYIVLLIVGFLSSHRTITHSLLALGLFSIVVFLILPGVLVPYMFGYLSHLLLDILNKKPVPIMYPKGKGVCLKLCYANKTANTCLMYAGLGITIIMIIKLFVH